MTRYRSWITLVLIGGISLMAAWQALSIDLDYEVRRLIPRHTAETEFYQAFQDSFGPGNNYLLIGLKAPAGIFRPSFLHELDTLTQQLKALPQTQRLLSPINVSYLYRDPLFGQFHQFPFLNAYAPDRHVSDSIRIYGRSPWVGALFGTDRQSVALFLAHSPHLSEEDCACLNDTVAHMLAQRQLPEVHLSGRCNGQTLYTRIMRREVMLFLSSSILLVMLFLAWMFRSWWGILIPMTVVGLAVVWTVGLMHATDFPLDAISNVIPSILLVVGLSSAIHILAKYQEEREGGQSHVQALKQALRQVRRANLLTALTTAVGFLTLLTADIISIQGFAIFASLGVVFAFVLAYTFLPAAMNLLQRLAPRSFQRPPFHQPFQLWLGKRLRIWFQWIIHHHKMILGGGLLLGALSVSGLLRLEVNSFLLTDLRPEHPLRQDFAFYDQHFAGARSVEVILSLPPEVDLREPSYWEPIDQLHQYLEQRYGLGQIYSPWVGFQRFSAAWQDDPLADEPWPRDSATFARRWGQFERAGRQHQLDAYLNPRQMRISGLIGDLGAQEMAQRDQALLAWIEQELPPSYRAQVTGMPTLIDQSNRLIARNVLEGLLIAFVVVSLLMGWLFRSWKMVLIALVPNLLPLMLIGAMMGFLGVPLKLSTAIIFTISFGIAVDDTIHFMNRLRWELTAGRSVTYAIKRTFLATGQAILLTTMILIGGFLTLTLSDFLGTFYIGLLVSLTLVFAVLADLILLPPLLWWVARSGKL